LMVLLKKVSVTVTYPMDPNSDKRKTDSSNSSWNSRTSFVREISPAFGGGS
jgi:hypothetical protein